MIGATGLLVVSTLRGQAPWRYRLPVRWVVLGGSAVAATLGIVVLSEPVTVALVVGICLVMVGVAVTSLSTTAGRRR